MADCCNVNITIEEESSLFTIEEENLAVGIAEEAAYVQITDESSNVIVDLESFIHTDTPEQVNVVVEEDVFHFTFDEVYIDNTGSEEMPYDKLTDNVIISPTEQMFYIGEATPGTVTSAASWRIKRRQILSSNGEFDVVETYAEGSAAFDKVWDSRLTYTY